MKVPLHVKCAYDKKVKLGRTVTVTYTVTNSLTTLKKVYVSMFNEKDTNCLVAGEIISSVDLMPGQEYNFVYNVIPLKLGMLDLPPFSVSTKHPNPT